MLVSVVVNNYNYARFLRCAVDSALGQTFRDAEVVVVDDGSNDGSREAIAGYSSRVVPVLKANGGQTSALNAGLRASRGELICFLDADDSLLPRAIERAVSLFDRPDVVKVHWPLWIMDENGRRTDEIMPGRPLSHGNLLECTLAHGPDALSWPPTSGNIWRRDFLTRIFPLPEVEADFNTGSASADACMSVVAPLYGDIARLDEPYGCYRRHGQNDYANLVGEAKIRRDLQTFDHLCSTLAIACRTRGFRVDPEMWKARSWIHRLNRSVAQIQAIVGAHTPFVFVDADQLRWCLPATANAIPCMDEGGRYSGPPPSDEVAIDAVERHRQSGANWMVFAWPAFWWLEHYDGLRQHLDRSYRCVERNDRLVVFDLRTNRNAEHRMSAPHRGSDATGIDDTGRRLALTTHVNSTEDRRQC